MTRSPQRNEKLLPERVMVVENAHRGDGSGASLSFYFWNISKRDIYLLMWPISYRFHAFGGAVTDCFLDSPGLVEVSVYFRDIPTKFSVLTMLIL